MSDNNDDLEMKKDDEKDEKELEDTLTSEEVKETEKEKKEGKKVEDKSLDVAALTKALREEIIESVRKEEKAKLYDSFEKYKTDAKTADEARKTAENKLTEYETSKLSVEEQSVLKLETLEESNVQLKIQMEELIKEANDKINSLQLELVKKEILAQYGDEMIPALVSGSTIEEIQQSAENAHREYVNIRERELAKMKETLKPKERKIGSGISPQNDRLNVGTTVADMEKITDPKVWEANREKFIEEALKS